MEPVRLDTDLNFLEQNFASVLNEMHKIIGWEGLNWKLFTAKRSPYISNLSNCVVFMSSPGTIELIRADLCKKYNFIDTTPRGCRNTFINLVIYTI